MQIVESSAHTLTLVYKRSLADATVYLLVGAPLFAIAVYVAGWGWGWPRTATGGYSVGVSVFLILLELGLVAGAVFFLSTMFDRTTYRFDRSIDAFSVVGRKSIFNRWSIDGRVSGIQSISCEVTGEVETINSEIHLRYQDVEGVMKTRKCGTGEITDDQAITESIRQFLAR